MDPNVKIFYVALLKYDGKVRRRGWYDTNSLIIETYNGWPAFFALLKGVKIVNEEM